LSSPLPKERLSEIITIPRVSGALVAGVFLTAMFMPLLVAFAGIVLNATSAVYRWFLMAHLGALLAFMLTHGVPALAMFRLRGADPESAGIYLRLVGYAQPRSLRDLRHGFPWAHASGQDAQGA
jgi:hypothetical protein